MILKFKDADGNTAKVTLAPDGDKDLVVKMMEKKYGFLLVEKSAKQLVKPTKKEVEKPEIFPEL